MLNFTVKKSLEDNGLPAAVPHIVIVRQIDIEHQLSLLWTEVGDYIMMYDNDPYPHLSDRSYCILLQSWIEIHAFFMIKISYFKKSKIAKLKQEGRARKVCSKVNASLQMRKRPQAICRRKTKKYGTVPYLIGNIRHSVRASAEDSWEREG